jgi:hypothetical protein
MTSVNTVSARETFLTELLVKSSDARVAEDKATQPNTPAAFRTSTAQIDTGAHLETPRAAAWNEEDPSRALARRMSNGEITGDRVCGDLRPARGIAWAILLGAVIWTIVAIAA